MTTVTITVTETIVYSKTYELAELEEYLGATLDGPDGEENFSGDLVEFIAAIQEEAHSYSTEHPGFAEDLERHGDVQGQVWEGVLDAAED